MNHRRDVHLTSGYRLVFAQDDDGEILVALIALDCRRTWGNAIPPFRVVVADLLNLLEPHDLVYDWGPVKVRLNGEFFEVVQGRKVLGNATRGHAASVAESFLVGIGQPLRTTDPYEFLDEP